MPTLASAGWVPGNSDFSWTGLSDQGAEISCARARITAISLEAASSCLALLDSRGGLQVLQIAK